MPFLCFFFAHTVYPRYSFFVPFAILLFPLLSLFGASSPRFGMRIISDAVIILFVALLEAVPSALSRLKQRSTSSLAFHVAYLPPRFVALLDKCFDEIRSLGKMLASDRFTNGRLMTEIEHELFDFGSHGISACGK